MHSLPKISVIIPVFNSVTTLEKAIKSVLAQYYPSLEIIIIDGGSTDGTVDIIKRYEKYIAYWHSKHDGSCGLAINIGLKKATGILTAQLMADDWFEPNTFHAIGEAYLKRPDVDVISCGGRFVKYDDKNKQYQTILSYTKPNELDITVYNMCFRIPAMSSRFITKAYISKIGYFDALDRQGKHNFSADREYLLRMAVQGCKNTSLNHLGHSYFVHDQSATFGNNIANKIKVFNEHLILIETYLQTYSLKKEDIATLKQWYCHQAVRLFFYELKKGEWKKAHHALQRGFSISKLQGLIALLTAPCTITINKGFPWVMEKIKSS